MTESGPVELVSDQFLIDGAGDVGQHASPVHSRASLKLIVEPGLYMLLRFQKVAGRGNYETGNQAFSKRLRFLTIRDVCCSGITRSKRDDGTEGNQPRFTTNAAGSER